MDTTRDRDHRPRNADRLILLVDDDALVAMSEARSIESFGFRTHTVTSGEAAVDAVRDDPDIDLVLMDINLGHGIDGTEAARRILVHRHVPIVFLTNHSERETVDRVKHITRYGYCLKTSGEFVLRETIEAAFEMWAREQDARHVFNDHAAVKLMIDPTDGRIVDANRAAEEFYGWPREALVTMTVSDINPAPPEQIRADIAAVSQGDRDRFELRHRLRDGSIRDVEVYSNTIAVDGRRYLHSIVIDTTERRTAMRRAEERRRYLEALFATSSDGIFVADTAGRIHEVNDAFCRMMDRTEDELVGLSVVDIDVGEDEERMAARVARVRERGHERFETRYRAADGRVLDADVAVSYLDLYGGRFVTFIRDITERKRVEQSERDLLRQKDILLSEVHHRMKNDMFLVAALLSLQAQDSEDPRTRAAIEEAGSRVRALSSVYQQLYNGPDVTRVRLASLVGQVLQSARTLAPDGGVRFVQEVDASLEISSRLSVGVGLMVNELVTNSLKHAFDCAVDPEVRVTALMRDAGTVELCIGDNGCGYDTDAVREPRTSHGLGIVHALVKQHGGTLELSNDGGARAQISLPIQPSDDTETPPNHEGPGAR